MWYGTVFTATEMDPKIKTQCQIFPLDTPPRLGFPPRLGSIIASNPHHGTSPSPPVQRAQQQTSPGPSIEYIKNGLRNQLHLPRSADQRRERGLQTPSPTDRSRERRYQASYPADRGQEYWVQTLPPADWSWEHMVDSQGPYAAQQPTFWSGLFRLYASRRDPLIHDGLSCQ